MDYHVPVRYVHATPFFTAYGQPERACGSSGALVGGGASRRNIFLGARPLIPGGRRPTDREINLGRPGVQGCALII